MRRTDFVAVMRRLDPALPTRPLPCPPGPCCLPAWPVPCPPGPCCLPGLFCSSSDDKFTAPQANPTCLERRGVLELLELAGLTCPNGCFLLLHLSSALSLHFFQGEGRATRPQPPRVRMTGFLQPWAKSPSRLGLGRPWLPRDRLAPGPLRCLLNPPTVPEFASPGVAGTTVCPRLPPTLSLVLGLQVSS